MYHLFIQLFNMSITAGWLILAVIVVRFLSKRMPKTWHCFLWYLVILRLLLPISIESEWSLIPKSEVITQDLLYSQNPISEYEDGNNTKYMMADSSLADEEKQDLVEFITPNTGDSVNPLQVIVYGASYIWLFVMVSMLLYTVIRYCRVARCVKEAVLLRDNIYQSEYVESPFVFGVIRPRIYVSFSLAGEALDCVIAHERTHIKRFDHVVRLLAFLLLSIYWFHPFVWVFYLLLCRDMELACDEMVLKQIGFDKKKLYSQTLLECSISPKKIVVCPLAFGEISVKQRIKNILNFRKPATWLVVGTLILCIVLVVCFMTNPVNKESETGLDQIEYNDGQSNKEKDIQDAMIHDMQEVEQQQQMLEQRVNTPEAKNLKEPPALYLQDALSSRYSEFCVQAGTYEWFYQEEEETIGITACGLHPLGVAANTENLIIPKYNKIDDVPYMFSYAVEPDYMEIEEYDIEDMGDTESNSLDKRVVRGKMFVSLKQNRIYAIRAVWEEGKMEERGFYGNAHYTVVTGEMTPLEDDFIQKEYDITKLDGVTMYMEKYKSTEGDMEILNESEKELQYGAWYEIQKYWNGNWYSLPLMVDNAAYEDIAYLLPSQRQYEKNDRKTSVWKINWSYFYGELPAGKYRIVKDFLEVREPGDFTKYYLAAEFEIK